MNDTDIELERRLRGWYDHELEQRVHAPGPLRDVVLAIPRTVPAGRRRLDGRGRVTLLAAAALLVALGGVAASAFLSPAPSVFVIAPSLSPEPSPSGSSPAPSASSPVVAVPSIEPSVAPVDGPPVASSWRAAGTMAEGRIAHTATLLADGRVLVTGGESVEGGALATTELWDPTTRTFAPTGPMHARRIGHAATLLADGRVFVVGGDGPDSAMASAEIWDPATGTFGAEIATPDNRGSGLTATTLPNGRVLVVGGVKCVLAPPRETPSCGDDLATLVWDPGKDGFTRGPRPHLGRDWGTATLLSDGRVLVVGGTGETLNERESAEVWSPSRLSFELVDEPREYRSSSLSATVLDDGRVLVAGGETGNLERPAWFGPLGSAETWDPLTGQFAKAGTMKAVRSSHAAGLLADGRVIVVGGSPERSAGFVDIGLETTEIWDPATGSFEAGPPMTDGRRAFTFTRLADGTYLAIGGSSRITRGELSRDVATAEQFGSFAP